MKKHEWNRWQLLIKDDDEEENFQPFNPPNKEKSVSKCFHLKSGWKTYVFY